MLWSLLAVLLIGMNTYFIFVKDSVQRSFYITDWKKVQKDDLIQTLNKSGKLAPAEKHRVYFDPKQGSFSQFLVQKGDAIQEGTPLYEYSVTDAKENRESLKRNVEELQGTQENLESHLQKLKQMKASAAAQADAKEDEDNDDSETRDADEDKLESKPELKPDQVANSDTDSKIGQESQADPELNPKSKLDPESNKKSEPESESGDSSGIEYSIELEISKIQLQIDKTESQIEAYQNQLQDLKDHETVKVKSQYTGTVKGISHDLKNPVITLASDKLLVQGQLSEQDSKVVKKGMKTVITSDHLKKDVEGKVGEIDKLPAGESSVYKDSSYPFTVQFNAKAKGAHPGYHVNVDIITAQALDAVAIPKKVMASEGKQKHTWVLSNQGTADKRKIKTGLSVDGKQEIKTGLKQGEWLAAHPEQIKEDGATFFTPLKWEAIHPSVLKQVSRYMLSRYFS